MRIIDFVPTTGILYRLGAPDAAGAVRELAALLARQGGLAAEQVTAALLEREHLGSTAIGQEIAIPHARFEVPRTLGVLGLAPAGIDFGAPDGALVRIAVAFLSPRQGGSHLHALAAIAQELSDASARGRLLSAGSAAEVHEVLAALRGRGSRPPNGG